jgi:hypothetical protein
MPERAKPVREIYVCKRCGKTKTRQKPRNHTYKYPGVCVVCAQALSKPRLSGVLNEDEF